MTLTTNNLYIGINHSNLLCDKFLVIIFEFQFLVTIFGGYFWLSFRLSFLNCYYLSNCYFGGQIFVVIFDMYLL